MTLSECVSAVLGRRGLLVLPSGTSLMGEAEVMNFKVARSKLADVPCPWHGEDTDIVF